MKQWLKEPLLHFIVLGAVIFLVYDQINMDSDNDYKIVIDDAKVNHIKTLWELQWKKQPTKAELDGLIERYVRQEIMYKEAKKLNLDQDDEIVKRRLSQKMEYLANDLTNVVAPPTDENLKHYFANNHQRYELPASYTFKLVTFSQANHADPKQVAKAALESVDTSSASVMHEKGDSVLLPTQFDNASEAEIAKTVGKAFYNSLDNQPLNTWVGPLNSSFGEHLVYISAKKDQQLPEFASVRDDIQRDYEFEMQSNAKGAIYREMKKQYTVVIDSPLLTSHQRKTILAPTAGAK